MSPKDLRQLLEKARGELTLLYEIGNALRTTLDFDETLYIILTSVTAQEGLGFNRAAIFLVDPSTRELRGRMGIGPETGEEAQVIWGAIQSQKMVMKDLIANYRSRQSLEGSPFHKTISSLKVPLTERAGGYLSEVVRTAAPLELIGAEGQAKAAEDPVLRILKTTSCVLVPLKDRQDKVVGVIFADNRITMKPIPREAFRLLALMAAHAGLAIENVRLYQAALQQADLDPLTQLWNRGAFQRKLMETLAHSEQNRLQASLFLIDMDHFKEYNDRAGHLEGDQALMAVSKMLQQTTRSGDYVARYGGEEFAVILPDTAKLNALKLAERIRLAMDQTGLSLTLSAGVATYPQDAGGWKDLLQQADKALYEAKRLGRNRVVVV